MCVSIYYFYVYAYTSAYAILFNKYFNFYYNQYLDCLNLLGITQMQHVVFWKSDLSLWKCNTQIYSMS